MHTGVDIFSLSDAQRDRIVDFVVAHARAVGHFASAGV
jgi:hypothetical protein